MRRCLRCAFRDLTTVFATTEAAQVAGVWEDTWTCNRCGHTRFHLAQLRECLDRPVDTREAPKT